MTRRVIRDAVDLAENLVRKMLAVDLVGLTADDLDRSPGEGDWTLREVLEHILSAEKSYSNRIEEALG